MRGRAAVGEKGKAWIKGNDLGRRDVVSGIET